MLSCRPLSHTLLPRTDESAHPQPLGVRSCYCCCCGGASCVVSSILHRRPTRNKNDRRAIFTCYYDCILKIKKVVTNSDCLLTARQISNKKSLTTGRQWCALLQQPGWWWGCMAGHPCGGGVANAPRTPHLSYPISWWAGKIGNRLRNRSVVV